jgi:hypothetical protein
VPVNTRAVVFVPAKVSAVSEGGVPVAIATGVKALAQAGGEAMSSFEVGSGTYTFTATMCRQCDKF